VFGPAPPLEAIVHASPDSSSAAAGDEAGVPERSIRPDDHAAALQRIDLSDIDDHRPRVPPAPPRKPRVRGEIEALRDQLAPGVHRDRKSR